MGGIVDVLTGNAGKKAAKKNAQATLKAANDEASANRLASQAAQQSQETMIAQKKASEDASALLSQPMDIAEVDLSTDVGEAEIDPATGRRRTARSSFMSSPRTSAGINI